MGTTTKIEWCDSTTNPTPCCTGCELYPQHCYAAGMQRRWGGKNPGWPASFTAPTYYASRIAQACRWRDLTGKPRPKKPWLDGMPRIVFVDDCGDPFAPFDQYDWSPKTHWLVPQMGLMARAPHIWVLLTKWPDRMADFTAHHGPFPANFWPGTSITDQPTAEARIPHILRVAASVRIISYEPVLGPVDFLGTVFRATFPGLQLESKIAAATNCGIHLMIVGGETGTGARPMHPQWARAARDQCQAAGVPFFFKSWGEWVPTPHVDSHVKASALIAITPDGYAGDPYHDTRMIRVGKPAAGRLLDGRTWDELPGAKGGQRWNAE